MIKQRNININDFILRYPGWLIFVGGFIVLMACQYTPAIIDYNARFVSFAQHALMHGLTYFPVINGNPYPDYPIGNTFLLYLAALPFGKISIFTIGIPYCLTAALILVLTYKLGALHDKKWGGYAVLFSLLTWQYVYNIQTIAVDVYVVLATVFCFYLVYSAKLEKANKRLWFLPLGLFFGLLTRGPIGLVVPAAIVGCFYLLNKNWRAFLIFGVIAVILLTVGFALLLGGAYLQGGHQFMHQVLMKQAIGRVHNYHKSRYYYYFTEALLPYAFTIFFALTVIVRKFRDIIKPETEQTKLLLYLVVWIVIILLGFTIPNTKQMRYVLPIVPAISLLAAYIFVNIKYFRITRSILIKLCFFMPIIGLAIIIGALIHNCFAALQLRGYFLPAAIILLGLFVVNIWARKIYKTPIIFGLGVVAFLIIAVFLMYPMIIYFKIPSEPIKQVIFLPYWPWS